MMVFDNLLNKLKSGDELAYKYLYDEYYGKLCRVANFYVKDSFVSENLVGDLIFAIWENREKLDMIESLNSYLFTSIRNRCYNYLKQAHVQREISYDKVQDAQLIYSMHSVNDLPVGILIEKELEEKIELSIDQLPLQTKKVFQLKRREELSYEEISSQLNISVNTVKYHMKSALLTLRVELASYLISFAIILIL
ncbi:MAG: RNA polymerase sigma-70 factor [Paludibacter sp.]